MAEKKIPENPNEWKDEVRSALKRALKAVDDAPNQGKIPSNSLTPSISCLAKLGSLIVHAEEMMSPKGHAHDRATFKATLADHEVQEWLAKMRKAALLPVLR